MSKLNPSATTDGTWLSRWEPENTAFWQAGGSSLAWRTLTITTLNLTMAFGKASVFKYISDDYPGNIGTISGIVGLAGGMGGFILPILFGFLMDLTGIRSSAFMLMYGVVWVSLIWMYMTEVRRADLMGRSAAGASQPLAKRR